MVMVCKDSKLVKIMLSYQFLFLVMFGLVDSRIIRG